MWFAVQSSKSKQTIVTHSYDHMRVSQVYMRAVSVANNTDIHLSLSIYFIRAGRDIDYFPRDTYGTVEWVCARHGGPL